MVTKSKVDEVRTIVTHAETLRDLLLDLADDERDAQNFDRVSALRNQVAKVKSITDSVRGLYR